MPGRTYKCNNCGYEKSFEIRGEMLDDKYFEETKFLQEELRKEVLAGQYGKLMKDLVSSHEDRLVFRRHEVIFQCDRCHNITVERDKRICEKDAVFSDYEIDIRFKIPCKKCGDKPLRNVYQSGAICPGCGSMMQCISMRT